jgi:hypothetical protein
MASFASLSSVADSCQEGTSIGHHLSGEHAGSSPASEFASTPDVTTVALQQLRTSEKVGADVGGATSDW